MTASKNFHLDFGRLREPFRDEPLDGHAAVILISGSSVFTSAVGQLGLPAMLVFARYVRAAATEGCAHRLSGG